MKLNHLNLTVTDVPRTRGLLETYFGLETLANRGDGFSLLSDGDGMVLTLMEGKQVDYPGTFHIGFMQESEERVNEINQRLKDDGFDVKPPGRFHGQDGDLEEGHLTFYFSAPGGLTIEVFGWDGVQSVEDFRSA